MIFIAQNTKPVIFASAGSTCLLSVVEGRGDGAMRMKHSKSSLTPKLFTAELTLEVCLAVELVVNGLYQVEVFTQLVGILFCDVAVEFG